MFITTRCEITIDENIKIPNNTRCYVYGIQWDEKDTKYLINYKEKLIKINRKDVTIEKETPISTKKILPKPTCGSGAD